MLGSTSLSCWEVYYENNDNKLTDSYDEPAYIVFRGKLTNVDVILLFKHIFQDHPEYKEGCTRFSAMSTLTIIEKIDMIPLLEIF